MALMFQDLSQIVNPLVPTSPPQLLSGDGNSDAILVTTGANNLVNALLSVGAVNTFTSLVAKVQASTDGSTGWVDCDDGTFDTVTAANGVFQILPVKLPASLTATSSPYIYLRVNYDITGTSAYVFACFLVGAKYDGQAAYQNSPPTIN